MARTPSPFPAEGEAQAEAPVKERRKTSADGSGKWESIDKISHIRRATPVTQENQGFEYLVHWSAPGCNPTWTPACDITAPALHEFWINNHQTVTIRATGYEPSAPTGPTTATAEFFVSPVLSGWGNESDYFDVQSGDSDDDMSVGIHCGGEGDEGEEGHDGHGYDKCIVL
ncbi:hypothetical protein F5B21DRAFT_496220 [Xylaria acuta]|nr:hypothetical protein F5B21DRAFT_496220 [Xylaria acuta]